MFCFVVALLSLVAHSRNTFEVFEADNDNAGNIVLALSFRPSGAEIGDHHFLLDDNLILWTQHGIDSNIGVWSEVYTDFDLGWVGRKITQEEFDCLINMAERIKNGEGRISDGREVSRGWNMVLFYDSEIFCYAQFHGHTKEDSDAFVSLLLKLIDLLPLSVDMGDQRLLMSSLRRDIIMALSW